MVIWFYKETGTETLFWGWGKGHREVAWNSFFFAVTVCTGVGGGWLNIKCKLILMNAQSKNERRLDDRPDETNHEGGCLTWYLNLMHHCNYYAWLKQGRLATSLPPLFLHLLRDPAVIILTWQVLFWALFDAMFSFLFGQSIPADMEFDPNSSPPCYKTKDEVSCILESWLTLLVACN